MAKKVIQINKNPVYDFGMISTVFNKDTEFNGDLTFKKSLQIDGSFEGKIESGGYLVVAEGATVKANIRARVVLLLGTIHGNIDASERLEIYPTGKLYGNIRTGKLKIADGVVFEGKCEMIKAAERKQPRAAAEKSPESKKKAPGKQEEAGSA